MRYPVIVVMLATLLSVASTATGRGRIFIGDGSQTCGAWTAERSADSPRSQL
jgi:hypothetical protein